MVFLFINVAHYLGKKNGFWDVLSRKGIWGGGGGARRRRQGRHPWIYTHPWILARSGHGRGPRGEAPPQISVIFSVFPSLPETVTASAESRFGRRYRAS